MANGSTPQGCGPSVDSLYSNLCDLKAAWGIVLEAFAAAGLVFSVVLVLSLLASLPFMHGRNRRGSVPLHAFLLLFTAGLFCLTFAFIVGKDFATCASRRFLFGVLFGGCFSCLLMQSVRVNVLTRTGSGPRAWRLCLGALGLWLVEVIINAEWLIVTVVRHPQGPLNATGAAPCNIANEDFAMALIYVMTLLLAALAASVAALAGRPGRWRREGVCILLAGLLSVGIWVAWVAMYVYGNGARGSPAWDDPTLAVALVANAWAFLLLYSIPQLCCLSRDDDPQEALGEVYPERAVGYETVLKDQGYQNMFMENKGFSMDEPNQGSKPVSPYSGYTGQLRASVYQPTELAIITKAGGNPSVDAYEVSIPRASLGPSAPGGSSPLQLQDAPWKANGSGVGPTAPRLLALAFCMSRCSHGNVSTG